MSDERHETGRFVGLEAVPVREPAVFRSLNRLEPKDGGVAHGFRELSRPGTNSFTVVFANEPPRFDERYEISVVRYVGEESDIGAAFGTPVSATDADEDTLKYTLDGNDAQNFDIDVGTGQLRTKTRLEYERQSIFYVVVSVSDGRGGSDSIGLEIRVLDSLVASPDRPTVERRVQVTADNSTINEGEEVTFVFTSLEAAPAGGLDVFYSLKQLAVDDDAEAYDFRPLPLLSTHHTGHVTIPEGATTKIVKFRTHPDQYEETDVLLVVSIGQRSISNFHGQRCHYVGDRNALTIESNPEGCWARVNVRDQGEGRKLRAPIPFARFASIFAGHDGYTGQNFQFIDPGEPMKFTISLSVPAPLGGLEIFYALYETSSDFVSTIPTYPTTDIRSVTIPEGESEVRFEIPTGEDDPVTDDCGNQVHIGEGCISARIFSASYSRNSNGQLYRSYLHYPSALRYALTTYVRLPAVTPPEIDLPAVTIEADRTPITEGETASFTLTVSTPAPDGGLVVEVALSEEGEGDFTDTLPETRTVTVPAGDRTVTVSVVTIDDAVDEPDGTIVARVVDRATAYTVGTPGTAEVVVQDTDLPAVTITADRTPITEGETASFTLTVSTPAPDGGLVVEVALSEEGEGDFTDTLPETRTVTVPAGDRTVTVSVVTIDDAVDEPDGTIVARVVDRATVYTVGTPGTAEVVVQDTDLPAVTITADRTPITEGETASFTLSLSTPAPDGGLAVEVALSEEGEGDFTDTLPESRTVTVPAGQSMASVSVATIDDAADEPDGKVVARVVERATVYTVGDPGTAEVVVQDTDLPAVTITADRTPIAEGETASFTVSVSTPAPVGGLEVEVALSEEGEGDFTDTLPESRTVTVPAGDRTASVSVATIDDAVDEPDGAIVARVVERATVYTVGDPGTAEVVVQDADLPAVTITADRTPITEGETASFTLTVSTPAPDGGLAVEVALSEEGEGDFTDSLPDTRSVTVPAGQSTASVSVATLDDTVDEPDGAIVARVQPQPGVFLVGTPGTAEVVVQDADLPAVTITADRTPITEGETASFTLTVSTPAPDGGLAVEVALSEEGGGDFTDSLPDTRSVTVLAGQSTASVSVVTIDDAADEPDGAIVARVVDRSTVYTVGDPGTAEVVVQDADLPSVTITADRTPITEGETASFTVSVSTPAPDGGLAVEVALSEEGGGDFTDSLPDTRSVTVPAGQSTASVSVATLDDTVDEPDGAIVARVQPQPGVFLVGTPGTAEVVVQDADLPAVTITADRTPITEGETASFT